MLKAGLRSPVLAALFGARIASDSSVFRRSRFVGDTAPAMLGGVASHAITPLGSPAATAVSTLLASLAHAPGWPLPIGGSQKITQALVSDLEAHGGTIFTNSAVTSWGDLPPARAYVFDTSAWVLASILDPRAETSRQRSWVKAIDRFPVGNAACRVDFIVSGPIPWTASEVGQAGTVHIGGSADDIRAAEKAVQLGSHAPRPVVLLSDPSTVDPGRAVDGKRAIWTYAHVPRGSTADMTGPIAKQIERFAPGFRDLVIGSRCVSAARMSDHNSNYRDGDIAAGALNIRGLVARPTLSASPYRTPWKDVYLCSASTPPGPGVHGMGGWNAARQVLRETFSIHELPSLAPGG